MTDHVPLVTELERLLDRAGPLLETEDAVAGAAAIRNRLEEPLRVAIAGRVKAGKSTLLNALVGERLAPTDAGECTKVVTWYRHGMAYEVAAALPDRSMRPLRFDRTGGRLTIDLGELDASRIERLEVTWPSAKLRRYTLIDTPGLGAHDEQSAARTARLLGTGGSTSWEVDAVIYLMRHLHRLDAEFLTSFTDRSLPHPSPVNAIGVLSRADEIGAGRPDALESARRVAGRYRDDSRIRALCATVVPVAGLIAETGRTLREGEGGSLQALARLEPDEISAMLLSVDRFSDPDRSPLDPRTRRELMVRLGMFGVRFCIDRARERDSTTPDLAHGLVEASGIEHLAATLDSRFGSRSALLKARSAIAGTKALLRGLPPSREADGLRAEVERIESAAPELGELRLLHLAASGLGGFDDAERAEVERLVSEGAVEERLGLADGSGTDAARARIVERLTAWRDMAAFPLAEAARREACELVATAYERLHADLRGI